MDFLVEELDRIIADLTKLPDNLKNGIDLGRMKQLCAERRLACLLYTSPSPRDRQKSRMPSSA